MNSCPQFYERLELSMRTKRNSVLQLGRRNSVVISHRVLNRNECIDRDPNLQQIRGEQASEFLEGRTSSVAANVCEFYWRASIRHRGLKGWSEAMWLILFLLLRITWRHSTFWCNPWGDVGEFSVNSNALYVTAALVVPTRGGLRGTLIT